MVKRVVVYIIGTLTLALGLVLNAKAALGVAPIVSVPFVLSSIIPLSYGMCTTLIYLVFVALQLLIRRKFDLKTILQIPFSYVFGLLMDIYGAVINIKLPFPFSIIQLLIAICLTAFGVFLMLQMDLIVNPADGFVAAFGELIHKPYGTAKMSVDAGAVCISLLMSFVFLHKIIGIGIGTAVAILLTGTMITFYDKHFGRYFAQINLDSRIKSKYDD